MQNVKCHPTNRPKLADRLIGHSCGKDSFETEPDFSDLTNETKC